MTKVNSVLLIDDDHINNYMNEKLIRRLKISDTIHVATNGSEALQIVGDQEILCPSLIFLDLSMPAIDGFQFLEIYQKMEIPDKDKILIVILTSNNFKDVVRLKQIGNYEFLMKPLNEEKLLEIVEKYFTSSDVTSDTRR